MLARGMTNYPGDWRYPFYIGFNAFYNQRDPERAASLHALRREPAGEPRVPAAPRRQPAGASPAGVDAAVRFLETMAEGTRDESARANIRRKIEDLRANRIPESLKALPRRRERAP